MKNLLRFAMGAALAGVLVNVLLKKQRAGETTNTSEGASSDAGRAGTASHAQPTGSERGTSSGEDMSSKTGMTSDDSTRDTGNVNGGNQSQDGRGDSRPWGTPQTGF